MIPFSSQSPWPEIEALGTLTDLYQLTMMAGYDAAGIASRRATFELFVRRLPLGRSYLVLAGIEAAIETILGLRIDRAQADTIRSWPVFDHVDPAWFDTLPDFRFRGDLWAVPEGTVVFAGEPLIRVEGTIAEAQWLETLLISMIAYPTLVASKASRIVQAAQGRPVHDFGTRRGHGPMAGLMAARAAYLAGFVGTSNVEAAIRHGIPASGTMAHSWVQAFDDEPDAFRAFARTFPGATLLVDTYDVTSGVRRAATIEPPIAAIRLDSGDLRVLSTEARSILDASGRATVKIIASGDLNETKIRDLIDQGAPIDSFGVGTELVTVKDGPALALVYKLVDIEGRGTIKLSAEKATYPWAKQVWRRVDREGRFAGDEVARVDEVRAGDPLLVPMVSGGRRIRPGLDLSSIRASATEQVASLPDSLRRLETEATYRVEFSPTLVTEAGRLGEAHAAAIERTS